MAQVYACIYYTYGILILMGVFIYTMLYGIPYDWAQWAAGGFRDFGYGVALVAYNVFLAFKYS